VALKRNRLMMKVWLMRIGGKGFLLHPLAKGARHRPRLKNLMRLILSWIFLIGCGGGGGGSAPPAPVFMLSGAFQAAAGNAVDSDVNDTHTIPIDNGDFNSAQTLTSPVILGGYVNVAGSGPQGNSRTNGDPDDFYQVALNSGDIIRLSLPLGAVASGADVQVQLYRAGDQALIDSLVGVVRTGSMPVAVTDTYFVRVQAVSGSTTYKLIMGDGAALTASTADSGLRLSSQFAPGEALVQWVNDTDAAAAARSLAMASGSSSRGKRPQLMRFSGSDQMRTAFQQLNISPQHLAGSAVRRASPADQAKMNTLTVIRALRRRPDVVNAEPNYIRRAALDPNEDPGGFYQLQWNLGLINLPQAWDLTTGDANVTVAVIDTGVLLDHPDLQNKIVPGWDFISDPHNAADGDGRDEDPADPGDLSNNDSSFHGTLVAGIAAADFNNGIGIAGVGGSTRIMPVRVLGIDGGFDSDLIAAIDFAAGLNNQVTSANVTVPARRADIINLSLGGPQTSTFLDAALVRARQEGVIIVAAAGNAGTNQPEYPAASFGVVSVGAVDAIGQRTYYTSYGATVDVAAPGGDPGVDLNNDNYPDGVLSTAGSYANGNIVPIYAFAFGTSFSAPHLAGVAALMCSARPGLTPDELDAYLAGGLVTTDIGDSGLGAGLIDAHLAVQAAEVLSSPTALAAAPNAIRLDSTTNSIGLTLRKLGPNALTVVPPVADAPWLSVASQSVDTDGLGTYRVNADRSNLAGGLHTASITIVTTINTVVVPVQVEVLPATSADAGFQYVVLMNTAFTQVITQQPAVMKNGAYTFSLDGIASGTYYLVAGTDLDNDRVVVEPGEAWGIYPSAVNPVPITINGDLGGVTFTTGFSSGPFADTITILGTTSDQ
jgi:serine protease